MTFAARLERHNAAALEANWTKEQAIEWAKTYAKKHLRWPARCWRVEGSPAGNSKLVTAEHAIRVQRRTGGEVVRLIPTPAELGLPAMTVNQTRVDGLPACPKCKEPVDFPCRTPARSIMGITRPGDPRPPHKERVDAAKPPPPPQPARVWIHDGKGPHTACGSLTTCNCTCRFCRKAWVDGGRPGGPRPARGPGLAYGGRPAPVSDEEPDPGTPPWGAQ